MGDETDFKDIVNENQELRVKLHNKVQALLAVSEELSDCQQQRDDKEKERFDLAKRCQALKDALDVQNEVRTKAASKFELHETNTFELLRDLQSENTQLANEVAVLKQQLADSQGDAKVLRQQLGRLQFDCEEPSESEVVLSPTSLKPKKTVGQVATTTPFSDSNDLVVQLETFKRENTQLERDLRGVLCEKEELVLERDEHRSKVERLNARLVEVMGGTNGEGAENSGEGRAVVDVDAVLMENRYLKDQLRHAQEENGMTKATLTKYKTVLENKSRSVASTLASSLNSPKGPPNRAASEDLSGSGASVLTPKQIREILQKPDSEQVVDYRALVAALLEAVNDKNIALSHQRKANRILGNRITELEAKLNNKSASLLDQRPIIEDSAFADTTIALSTPLSPKRTGEAVEKKKKPISVISSGRLSSTGITNTMSSHLPSVDMEGYNMHHSSYNSVQGSQQHPATAYSNKSMGDGRYPPSAGPQFAHHTAPPGGPPSTSKAQPYYDQFAGVGLAIGTLFAENILSHPCTVLRSQCQVSSTTRNFHLTPVTLMPVIFNLNRHQGPSCLWKGLSSCLVVRGTGLLLERVMGDLSGLPREITRNATLHKTSRHFLLKSITFAILTPFSVASLVDVVQSNVAPSARSTPFEVLRVGAARLASDIVGSPSSKVPVYFLLLPHVCLRVCHYALSGIVQFVTSNNIRRKLEHKPALTRSAFDDFFPDLFAAFTSHLIADAVVYPAETVVSRMFLQGSRALVDDLDNGVDVIPAGTVRHDGFVDCIKAIWSGEGLGGFYRGFGALVLQYAIHLAVLRLMRLVCEHIEDNMKGQTGRSESRSAPIMAESTQAPSYSYMQSNPSNPPFEYDRPIMQPVGTSISYSNYSNTAPPDTLPGMSGSSPWSAN